MKNLFAIEDNSTNPAPKEVYNYRIILLAISAAMGSAMYGYDSGFIGGTLGLVSFQHRFGLDSKTGDELANLKSNIVSTFQAGCFFGAFLAYIVSERFGRRLTLMYFGIIFNIGVTLQVAANGIVGLIYAGRTLTGLAVGTTSMIVPIYISEWAPPLSRGRMVGIYEVVYQCSSVIAFWINYGVDMNISDTSDAQWRIPFALQYVFGAGVVICMYFQPESYRWNIKAGHLERAFSDLSKIRQLPRTHPYIQWEVQEVELQLLLEEELNQSNLSFISKMKELWQPGTRIRIILGCLVMVFQNLSGINALNYYSPLIFESIGFKGNSVTLLATGIFGIIKLVTNLLFILVIVDRFGRRKSLFTGALGTIVAMFYIAGYTKVSGSFEKDVPKDGGAYMAIVMVYIFAFFYAFSWNGVPFIYCSEIFPNKIRSLAMSITVMVQWLMQFVIVYSNPYMMQNITYGTFLFFGFSLVLSLFFVYFFLPETQGLSLENMDTMFNAPGLAIAKRKAADLQIQEDRLDHEVAAAAAAAEMSDIESKASLEKETVEHFEGQA